MVTHFRTLWIIAALCICAPLALAAQGVSPESRTYPRLRLGGFSDLNFLVTDRDVTPSTSVSEGQFTLHFTSILAPRLSFFAEVTLSPEENGFATELERSVIKFDHSDLLKLSAGRYHTPINWWNTAFHHGLWLQTSVGRPEMTKFGSHFLPVHFVGALAQGALHTQATTLSYQGGIGNGRSSITNRAGDLRDSNNNRAWLFNLSGKLNRYYWLDVGGAIYRDLVTLSDSTQTREWIASAFVVWAKESPELITEYAHVRHEDESDQVYSSDAVYVQVAYRLPWLDEQLKPYARWEVMDVRTDDPVFGGTVEDLKRFVAGLRWDASELLAVKTEYQFTRTGESANEQDENSGAIQLSVAF